MTTYFHVRYQLVKCRLRGFLLFQNSNQNCLVGSVEWVTKFDCETSMTPKLVQLQQPFILLILDLRLYFYALVKSTGSVFPLLLNPVLEVLEDISLYFCTNNDFSHYFDIYTYGTVFWQLQNLGQFPSYSLSYNNLPFRAESCSCYNVKVVAKYNLLHQAIQYWENVR